MNKRINALVISFAAIAAMLFMFSAAQATIGAKPQVVGTVNQITGQVVIVRSGKTIKNLKLNAEIVNNDQIQTGKNSSMEIAVSEATGMKGTVTVKSGTSFYFNLTSSNGNSSSLCDIMTGGVNVSVKKTGGTPAFGVRTQTAAMGVRGTTFGVSTSINGGLAVGCTEGEVACYDVDGEGTIDESTLVSATPGTVVTKNPGESFKQVPVATSSWDEFRDKWIADEVEIFRANPVVTLSKLEKKYNDLSTGFKTAIAALAKSKTLQTWFTQDDNGQTPANPNDIQVLKEKKELYPLIIGVYKNTRIFEIVYFRIADAIDFVPPGSMSALLADKTRVDAFIKKFNADKATFSEGMSLFRAAVRAYAARNEGSVAGIMDDNEDF